MKAKYAVLGLFVIGILFFGSTIVSGVKGEEGTNGDEDKDGITDEFEEANKRDIEVWIGDNVIEVASIKRQEDKKDIIDLRVGFNDYGISIRVSYGTYVKCETEEPEEPTPPEEPKPPEDPIPPEGEMPQASGGDCDYTIEFKLTFEVLFKGIIEYVDLNENGVLDEEEDEIVSDYGFNSFKPIDYSLQSISDDSSLHYILINTTDGIFALHIYLVEEFVYVDETLITPTEAKIDIEITNYNYSVSNSQLALSTKLWSEETYKEREETKDEEEGYASDEKEVFVENDVYSGFFSWKETALVDGVEMDVLTKRFELEEENLEWLLICYPRGDHIYHDPKIGILIGVAANDITLIVLTISSVSVISAIAIAGLALRRRKVR
ncbi:MAG: hypothetical protein ACXABG_13230 [Promethearchaeota archaeon]